MHANVCLLIKKASLCSSVSPARPRKYLPFTLQGRTFYLQPHPHFAFNLFLVLLSYRESTSFKSHRHASWTRRKRYLLISWSHGVKSHEIYAFVIADSSPGTICSWIYIKWSVRLLISFVSWLLCGPTCSHLRRMHVTILEIQLIAWAAFLQWIEECWDVKFLGLLDCSVCFQANPQRGISRLSKPPRRSILPYQQSVRVQSIFSIGPHELCRNIYYYGELTEFPHYASRVISPRQYHDALTSSSSASRRYKSLVEDEKKTSWEIKE